MHKMSNPTSLIEIRHPRSCHLYLASGHLDTVLPEYRSTPIAVSAAQGKGSVTRLSQHHKKPSHNSHHHLMKLKELESYLSSIDNTFPNPTIELEQYPTSAHLASRLVFNALPEVENKTVLELGCGTGILSIAASLVGASYVLGVDCDQLAVEKAKENLFEVYEEANVDFMVCKLPDLPFEQWVFG
jgi:SAM-dependent methyltransferase